MANPRYLAHAPIVEALVDFRIVEVADIDAKKLNPLREQLASAYPKVDERRKMQAAIELGDLPTVSTEDLGFLGLVFTSATGTAQAQFRQNGFTYNKLPPYEDADKLFAEAVRLWEMYAKVVGPSRVVRLGLRYINSLRLPFVPGEAFQRYLASAPQVPPGLPTVAKDFLTRIVLLDEAKALTAIITQHLGLGPVGEVPVILDVDVFTDRPLPVDASSLLARLQEMRELKNRAFFSYLTEDAVSLFA